LQVVSVLILFLISFELLFNKEFIGVYDSVQKNLYLYLYKS